MRHSVGYMSFWLTTITYTAVSYTTCSVFLCCIREKENMVLAAAANCWYSHVNFKQGIVDFAWYCIFKIDALLTSMICLRARSCQPSWRPPMSLLSRSGRHCLPKHCLEWTFVKWSPTSALQLLLHLQLVDLREEQHLLQVSYYDMCIFRTVQFVHSGHEFPPKSFFIAYSCWLYTRYL